MTNNNEKDIVIEVQNLYKVFGKNRKKALRLCKEGEDKKDILATTGSTVGVDNVSFKIEKGEIFVIMGLSGSGKSTILRCLNQLYTSTEGNIIVNGTEITGLEHKDLRKFRQENMSMVFQQFALLPHRSVLENTCFGLEVQGINKEERLQKGKEVLESVGLSGWENEYPIQLSGGMKQRVGLARALSSKPDIMLMDEAFSALDPLIREDMQDLLLELLGDSDKTVVFITHDLNEALKLGDHIAFLKDGELIQVGTPDEIIGSPANDYVAKFVRGVDLTKILTVSDVMKKTHAHVNIKNGPSAALHAMKEHGISSIFVVDKAMNLKGIITADEASKAKSQGIPTLGDLELTQSPVVNPDLPINDCLGLIAESNLPLAVINQKNKLLGIVVRGSVIAALDNQKEGEINA